MTREEQLHAIAKNLNAKVDVPAIPEWAEQVGFDWLVARLDSLIPDRLLAVMVSASDGISEDEADLASEFVQKFLLSRLPALIADMPKVQLVVDRIGETVFDLLLSGKSA